MLRPYPSTSDQTTRIWACAFGICHITSFSGHGSINAKQRGVFEMVSLFFQDTGFENSRQWSLRSFAINVVAYFLAKKKNIIILFPAQLVQRVVNAPINCHLSR